MRRLLAVLALIMLAGCSLVRLELAIDLDHAGAHMAETYILPDGSSADAMPFGD